MSQAGTVSTSLAIGTSEVADRLRTKTSSVIVDLDVALTIENEVDRPTINALKRVKLNLAVLLCEALHLLQDGGIAELRAREYRTLQVISEQQINNEKMALQRNVSITAETKVTNQRKHILQVIEEACRMVLELAILEEDPIEVCIHKLATGVCNT